MRVADFFLGRRVDPLQEPVTKFFPNQPPRRGDIVIVGEPGQRCRVTHARVRFDHEPVPHPKFGLNSPLYRWRLLSLRIRPL